MEYSQTGGKVHVCRLGDGVRHHEILMDKFGVNVWTARTKGEVFSKVTFEIFIAGRAPEVNEQLALLKANGDKTKNNLFGHESRF